MLPEQVRDRPGRGSHARIRDARHDRSGSRLARGRWTWSRPSSENDLADDVENKSADLDKHDDPSRSRESTKHGSKTHDSGYEIITTLPELERLARELLREDVVAFDTEADSFYHYFDKVCLVQVATRKKCWLIDPLAIGGPDKLAPLAPIFSSPKVRVLFHAAEYDIYVLKRDCGFEFKNLFDTMVSAQLLGYPAIGLAALVEKHFGVSLPKDEQRSDWSRRPLRDKQISYAASDVLYLIKLAEKLEKELVKAGRLDWAKDEFETLCGRRWPDRDFDKLGYLRIKGARSLDPVALAILRELFLLRDERAREIDRPPFKVLGNRTLLDICHAQTADLDSLSEIKGISDLILKRMGKHLVAAVKKGLRKPHGPIPKLDTGARRRMDRRTEKRLASLKNWRGPRAQALKLDPGVLCPNAALEAIAWTDATNAKDLQQLPELKTWLVREFADEILDVLGRHEADAAEETAQASDTEKGDKPKRARRSGRGRSGASRAKARARRAQDSEASDTSAASSKGASPNKVAVASKSSTGPKNPTKSTSRSRSDS